ncbi:MULTISPECIES: KTSC domain-containing protein [unclassified Curtobacterium]|uniref:KTSC domain-containing protein n=1 Tax=unclassified Curtobacterium TaxID=257496 RepID=UPI0010DC24DB|nr:MULTISPECIES: KTSC domain-containing protein [unclassified Curtobacterium]TCL80049.1 KTSC domain-containing protein [Curtobacterium sp. PhB128]TCL97777.1 KTSC domain-containing protein [Curtobacterium sp. PhB138]
MSVGYDEQESALEVEFVGGAVRLYFEVPQSVFEGFVAAQDAGANVGLYFDVRVNRGGYRYLEI